MELFTKKEKKILVVQSNDIWTFGRIIEGNHLLETTRQIIYLGLKAGILEEVSMENQIICEFNKFINLLPEELRGHYMDSDDNAAETFRQFVRENI